jgi:hypothetical protein
MSWRERTAEILANAPGSAPTKPPEARPIAENAQGCEPTKPSKPLLSVLSAAPPPLSGEADDPTLEARRRRVLALLAGNPTRRYALVTDAESEPGCVILTLAVRDRATCDLRIALDKYDPFLLLELIERHGSTVQ